MANADFLIFMMVYEHTREMVSLRKIRRNRNMARHSREKPEPYN